MVFKDIDIKNYFELMREYEVSELSLKDGKFSIDIKRHKGEPVVMTAPTPAIAPVAPAPPAPAAPPAAPPAEPVVEEAPAAPPAHYKEVIAPLVGTFYRSSSPEADPFIEVGDRVGKGDVLCIVEAMKSMNEIPTEVSGVVKEICVENAELVEFEQVLFRIDTKG